MHKTYLVYTSKKIWALEPFKKRHLNFQISSFFKGSHYSISNDMKNSLESSHLGIKMDHILYPPVWNSITCTTIMKGQICKSHSLFLIHCVTYCLTNFHYSWPCSWKWQNRFVRQSKLYIQSKKELNFRIYQRRKKFDLRKILLCSKSN